MGGDFWDCLGARINLLDRGFAELLDCLSVSVFSFRDDPCVSVFIRVPMKFFGCGSAALCSSVSNKRNFCLISVFIPVRSDHF